MTGEQLPGADRFPLPGRGQASVGPAGEQVPRVPLALAVAQQHQAGGLGPGVRGHAAAAPSSPARAARPGRVFPSRYSRLAPPPVETCPKKESLKPEGPHRGRGVAAADHGEGVAADHRPGDRPGALGVTRVSRRRPSGRSRRWSWTWRAWPRTAAAVAGPMSKPIRSAGMALAATTSDGPSADRAGRHDHVLGQHEFHPGADGPVQVAAGARPGRLRAGTGRPGGPGRPGTCTPWRRPPGSGRRGRPGWPPRAACRRPSPRRARPCRAGGCSRSAAAVRPSPHAPGTRRRAAAGRPRRRRWRAGGARRRTRPRRTDRPGRPAGRRTPRAGVVLGRLARLKRRFSSMTTWPGRSAATAACADGPTVSARAYRVAEHSAEPDADGASE